MVVVETFCCGGPRPGHGGWRLHRGCCDTATPVTEPATVLSAAGRTVPVVGDDPKSCWTRVCCSGTGPGKAEILQVANYLNPGGTGRFALIPARTDLHQAAR